jgi:hypothetical protein
MIDYNRLWHVLDIDISNALRANFDFDKLLSESEFANNQCALWNFKGCELTELFDHQWLTYFNSLGFDIQNVLLFYRTPKYVHPIVHIDYVGTSNPVPAFYALNFVASLNDDSEMVWYNNSLVTGSAGTDARYNNPQNRFEYWPKEQLADEEIDRRCIGQQLTLVSTGNVHDVTMGNQPRWAVSIRLVPNFQINSWQDAVNFFLPFIKKEI